jgi:DNA-directed RNA polymerase subunit RPC12/RpoP
MTATQRTFHGNITPQDFAGALNAEFNRGNLRVRQVGRGDGIMVQITSPSLPTSGGTTALTVFLQDIEDGVTVQLGQQEWLGVAASLGKTALMAFRNPLSILGRFDDVAQDISALQLSDRIWQTITQTADQLGASFELSERLRRLVCPYCTTANPVGAPHCSACGAPLGSVQPITCPNCGYVTDAGTSVCPQCQHPLGSTPSAG